jgi:hypothetical protein
MEWLPGEGSEMWHSGGENQSELTVGPTRLEGVVQTSKQSNK